MATVIEIVQPTGAEVVELTVPGMQGPSALSVGPTNTLTPGHPGLWIETDGDDITFWIEDGE